MRRIAPLAAVLAIICTSASAQTPQIPRLADGKPNLQGIWQAMSTAGYDLQEHAASLNMLAGKSVVEGGAIPYLPAAAAQRAENFRTRLKSDPVEKCFMPGVPRIMYMEYPFQILQSSDVVSMAFEWTLDYRVIRTDGSKHIEDLDSWMGDSRGHWEGDTFVVDVTHFLPGTWLDMAGDFHSDALHVVERYKMTGRDTIDYKATLEDPKVFSKPFTVDVTFHRRTDRDRLYEYHCQAEKEEANGDFEREARTWYPDGKATTPTPAAPLPARAAAPAPANLARMAGKPDIHGLFQADAGGSNYGIEKHKGDGLVPGGRGVIIDPADGLLPLQPWAAQERVERNKPERGYEDPTAHCFPAGVPRSLYVPSAFYIMQTPEYVAFYHERVAWRMVPLNGRPHPPENVRFWQGDSVGRWDGDSLVIDTTNFNGKTWLNEVGDVLSYAAHVVERFTPAANGDLMYEAVINDPVVYTKPWTISFNIRRQKGDVIEAACHEEDQDLPHLKAVRDEARKKKQ